MKRPAKTFRVQSLFEGANYIGIFSEKTGDCLEHLYNGAKAEAKKAKEYIIYKCNGFGQRKELHRVTNERRAAKIVSNYNASYPNEIFIFLPVYEK